MSWQKFNVNDIVRVKLKPKGQAILMRNCLKLYDETGSFLQPPAADDEGYTAFQLWQLMETFGPHTSMGEEPCFETTILLPGN